MKAKASGTKGEGASLTQLVVDTEDGKLSHSKIGVIIAGGVFTLKMLGLLPNAPEDSVLWLIFMGTLGGYSVLLRAVAGRYTKKEV